MPISLTWESLRRMLKKLSGTLVIQEADLPRVQSLMATFMPGITIASAASTLILASSVPPGEKTQYMVMGFTEDSRRYGP